MPFTSGRAVASPPGSHLRGLIDRDGRWVVPPQYDQILPFEPGETVTAVALADSKGWRLMDRDGHFPIAHTFQVLRSPREGIVPFTIWYPRLGLQFGLMTLDGRVLVEPRFDRCEAPVRNGLIGVAREDEKWGVINVDGEWVIDPVYTFIGAPGDGLFLAYQGGRRNPDNETLEGGSFGYVDRAGKIVIPFQFDEAFPFEDGYARVHFYNEDCPAHRGLPCDVFHTMTRAYVDVAGKIYWQDMSRPWE